jgi:predicted methyltransferase
MKPSIFVFFAMVLLRDPASAEIPLTHSVPVPAYVAAAVAAPSRPPDQVGRDANRKPAETIAFAGLKPGDRIGDFMPGSGYFTRIFSRVVGPKGHVYAFNPDEEIANCPPGEVAGSRALANDRDYANVTVTNGPVNSYGAPEKLDMVWTAQNYHDLHDPFMGPANIPVLNARIFHVLKHGGVFLVIDHVAEPGSGLRDTNTLHRIDPAAIVKEVEAAGFMLVARSDMLRNPADAHTLFVFDPRIRGKTDQVMLKFVRP